MPARGEKKKEIRRKPAETLEGRENQLVSLAIDLAEKQMTEGTASAQVISHYLKLGSTREQLEQDRMAQELELLKAKVGQLQSAVRHEELLEQALRAFGVYSGREDEMGELGDGYED